ncbi:RING-type domain-containing protein [Citrus sinensis]|nr:RING-type domain-containing protein [Citrus sinensis]
MAQEESSAAFFDLAVDDLYFSALFDKENQEDDLAVDDLYFSALIDKENQEDIIPVSDEMYAEELQFQEAGMASTISSQMAKSASPSSSLSSPPSLPTQACLGPQSEPIEVTVKAGESSLSFCEICCERKEKDQMFKIESCIHSICSDCISKHVATKIQVGVITRVTCPGLHCKSVLEYDACRPVLPKEVLELWEEALCQELIDASQRLFCAQCYVPWHPGVNCEEYQRLNVDERGREDLMVRELAKEKKWSRCPHCKYYVERTEGCPHMTCRTLDAFEAVSKTGNIYLFCQVWTVTNAVLKNHRMHLVGGDALGANFSSVMDVKQNGLKTMAVAQENNILIGLRI